jgi:ABC-type taurine transport system ATPase subunit
MNAPLLRAGARGAIEISEVVKTYDAGGQSVLAVDHCSLSIRAGEICMIVGPSGCGKTTLLNAIAGFHSIASGSIVLDGRVLCGPGQPRASIGSDRIVVFQRPIEAILLTIMMDSGQYEMRRVSLSRHDLRCRGAPRGTGAAWIDEGSEARLTKRRANCHIFHDALIHP